MDKDVVHIYIYIGILVIKNNKIMSLVATWMDLAIIILSEISNTETRQILYDSTLYVESKRKIMQIKLFANRNRHPDFERRFVVAGYVETLERER